MAVPTLAGLTRYRWSSDDDDDGGMDHEVG